MPRRRLSSSFTAEGKVAPPKPTMPASPTRRQTSSGARAKGSAAMSRSAQRSSPSTSSTSVGSGSPDGCGAGYSPSARTRPEVGACSGAEILPWPAASNCPLSTRWPTPTTGMAISPTCCCSGMNSSSGSGRRRIGCALDSSLRPAGWTPPRQRFHFIFIPPGSPGAVPSPRSAGWAPAESAGWPRWGRSPGICRRRCRRRRTPGAAAWRRRSPHRWGRP